MPGLTQRLTRLLGSRRFLLVVLGFFVLEGVWVALSAMYPMAFDEDFHFGIIQIYSQQWLPFLSGQPPDASVYGALATDPSYLYHYLMSFPHRVVASFTDSLFVQVVALRLINVGIFAAAVALLHKVLRRAGTSAALANLALLIFALVPTVPLLAGQINYDSLFVLGVAATCWLVLGLTEALRRRRIDVRLLALLAVTCLLTSLVKYAFLPMGLVVAVYVVVLGWRQRAQLWPAIQQGYAALGRATKIALLAGVMLAGGLFVQRYVVNAVSYGHPLPPCEKVLSVGACQEYGPWARNYRLAADPLPTDKGPLAYTWLWLQSLHYRLFFMINGPHDGHTNYPPSPLPSASAVVIALSGLVALAFTWRRVFAGRPFLLFLLGLSAVYLGFLWFDNYTQYLETGQPVAINGRYLIPLLVPLAAVVGRALSLQLHLWPWLKTWAATLAIVCCLQGGGVLGFIVRSDHAWYWRNNSMVQANDAARAIIQPLIFEGPKHY